MSFAVNDFRKDSIDRELAAEADNVLRAVATHIASLANKNSPIGANTLLSRSFYGAPVEFGKRVDVASRTTYGEYVEFGTKPHWPPFDAIRIWVDAKVTQGVINIDLSGGSTSAMVKRRKHPPRTDERSKKVDAIARAIQRKIAAKGTQPQGMLARSLKEAGVTGINIVKTENGLEYEGDITPVIQSVAPGLWDRIASRA